MYNNKMLDEIYCNIDKMICTIYKDGKRDVSYDIMPNEAAHKIAGIIADKYMSEVKCTIRTEYDHYLGCKVIKSVSYPNGVRWNFEYVY